MRAMMNQMNTQEKLQQNEDLAELRAATSLVKHKTSVKPNQYVQLFKKRYNYLIWKRNQEKLKL